MNKLIVTTLLSLATLLVSAGCQNVRNEDMDVVKAQTKVLMDLHVRPEYSKVFKKIYRPDESRLLVGPEVKKWFERNPNSLSAAPKDVIKQVEAEKSVGLLIHGKYAGNVLYLMISSGIQIGIGGIFFTPDLPCSGGKRMCTNCTRCSGETEKGGTIKTCVCTTACPPCRACPSC